MNLNRLCRLLLLQLFVLLQCMAPLAHAHVNGDHADQHVHLAEGDMRWLDDHDHHSGLTHLAHGEPHSVVVCIPPEFRCSVLVIDQPAAANKHDMFVSHEHPAITVAGFYSPPLLLISYQHPDSQAPPV